MTSTCEDCRRLRARRRGAKFCPAHCGPGDWGELDAAMHARPTPRDREPEWADRDDDYYDGEPS